MRTLNFSDGFESSTQPSDVTQPATSVSVTPSGNLASTDAQAALEELQGDIDTLTSDVSTVTSDLATHEADTTSVHGISDTSALATKAGSETLTNKTISGASNTISDISLTTAVTGTLPIGNGGTGQTTANAALNALLPTQSSSSGKYLKTDGTSTSWDTVFASTAVPTVYVFTSSGTYTKNASAAYVRITVVAGGASGGGCQTTAASSSAAAGGGGAGGVSIRQITNSSLGSTETVTVGAGGAAPSVGNNAGNAGGSSSFGTWATATGGSAGAGCAATTGNSPTTDGVGGSGGVGSSGDVNLGGGDGLSGRVVGGVAVPSGAGGSNRFGGNSVSTLNASGAAGKNYGGGGAGGANATSHTAVAGGAGAGGIVIVEEYT